MSAKVIPPTAITDAVLTSSSVPEPDAAFGEVVWSPPTSYTVGQRVIRTQTHRVYENLIAGVNATAPELAALETPPRWLDIGPTNRYAIFDGEIGSTTKAAGSFTYTLQTGSVGSLAFIEIVNATSITASLKDMPGGTVVWTGSRTDLDGAAITDFYDFFFEPFQQLDRVVFDDIPASYTDAELTFTVTSAGIAEVGVVVPGLIYDLGTAEFGAQLGIIDYSRKTTDQFGRTSVTRRRFSSTFEARLLFDQAMLTRVFKLLAELRSTPCVWIGTSEDGYETTIVYGFYSDFSIDLAFPTINYCSLRVESLT